MTDQQWILPQKQRELGWDIFPLLPRRKTVYAHYVIDGNGDTEPTAWSIDKGWTRLDEAGVAAYWPSGGSHNIGIATGARSGVWVLDVDMIFNSREEDDERSQAEIDLEDEAAARDYVAEMTGIEIPETLSVQTASGKWHFYFEMPDQPVYITSSVSKLGPKIDVRGDGGMAMGICSSVVGDDGVERFYRVVRMMKPIQAPAELVERVRRKVDPITAPAPASVEKDVDAVADALAQQWIEEELQTLRTLHRPWVEGSNWHNTCFEVACTLNEFANSPWCSLTPETAQARYLEAAPAAERDWNPMTEWGEGLRKTVGQGRMKPAVASDQSWFHDIGAKRPSQPRAEGDPVEAVTFPRPNEWYRSEEHQISLMQESQATFDLASEIRHILPEHEGEKILANHQGVWYYWNGAYWEAADDEEVQDYVAQNIAWVKYEVKTKDGSSIKSLDPSNAKVVDVAQALARFMRRPDSAVDASTAVHLVNGTVDIDGRAHHVATPSVFNLAALPFEYDPDAECPQWESFLMDIFEHDPAAALALQEWFGYFLVGDPGWLQKMFWLIGPKRSGKGTILDIANRLMGSAATAATLTGFSKDFGREALVGKRLAIIDDARDPDPRVAHSVVEFLLTLSSGGLTTVSRKYKQDWGGRLTACLLAASNTIPRMPDDGGAISSRLEIIKTRKSFIGHEDTHLGERLTKELPGILNWALDGLDRLREQGRFTQAEMASDVRQEVDLGATGATPFVKDMLIEHGELGVSARWIRDALHWWADQQEDGYRPSALALKPAIQTEFPDAKPRTRATLADGSSDNKAWKGITLKCRECDAVATRVTPVVGPECPMHMSNDFMKSVSA